MKNIILSLVIKFNESDEPGSSYYEETHVENECGTLLFCFATHLNYGMRFDWGNRMEEASYTYEK